MEMMKVVGGSIWVVGGSIWIGIWEVVGRPKMG